MTVTVEMIPRLLYRVLQKITHEPRIDCPNEGKCSDGQ